MIKYLDVAGVVLVLALALAVEARAHWKVYHAKKAGPAHRWQRPA